MSNPISIEDLMALVVSLREELAVAKKEIVALSSRVVELEAVEQRSKELEAQNFELRARLGMDSSNSSMPPSSDGPGSPPRPRSLRRGSGRRPGGQSGHQGTTLRQVSDPDRVITHAPDACWGCGAALSADHDQDAAVRQVFDIPAPQVHVTEHRILARRCTCGRLTRPGAPAGVDAPVQYGPGIAAIGVYLYQGQFCSKDRTAQALAELFGVPVSTATISTWVNRAARDLGPFTTHVAGALAASPLLHVDETSIKHPGGRLWIHSASNHAYSLLTAHPRRGRAGMDQAGVLPSFTGTLVHDAFAPYDTYTAVTRHVLCGAHLLRELQAVTDHHQHSAGPGTWCWATQVTDALIALHRAVKDAPLDPKLLDQYTHLIRTAATIGANHDPADNLTKKHRALARRILTRQDDYLAFAQDPPTPFTNNPAEQEVRMVKLRAKISGCLRTLTGAQQFTAIRSYLATARKHHIPMLHALTALTSRNPWTPATT